jgi:hypothetical protein|tara:strand:- start:2075 stop:2257 length:183 start_codon:yes stop_codon:yes gene_type:complete
MEGSSYVRYDPMSLDALSILSYMLDVFVCFIENAIPPSVQGRRKRIEMVAMGIKDPIDRN